MKPLNSKIYRWYRTIASAAPSYLARIMRSRRTQLYCVGTAKSGTNSIRNIFDKSVRSAHEKDSEVLIKKIIDVANGKIQHRDLISYVKKRDKHRYLEVDSSQLNFFLLDILLQEFPLARYILTIRDCYSWLDSFINHSLSRTGPPEWRSFRDFRFSSQNFTHPKEEHILKQNNLYTLDGYLSYWAMHNKRVLSTIPDSKLFIVKTNEIPDYMYSIAKFAGLPPDCIAPEGAHSFKNPKKYGILRQINSEHIEEKVHRHCASLMREFFPNIRSLSDAGI